MRRKIKLVDFLCILAKNIPVVPLPFIFVRIEIYYYFLRLLNEDGNNDREKTDKYQMFSLLNFLEKSEMKLVSFLFFFRHFLLFLAKMSKWQAQLISNKLARHPKYFFFGWLVFVCSSAQLCSTNYNNSSVYCDDVWLSVGFLVAVLLSLFFLHSCPVSALIQQT